MTPSLTHGAFRQMYADQCFLAVGADVLGTLKPLLPQSISYLVLEPDGCLREPKAGQEPNKDRLKPHGMAIGLKCMVVGRDTEQAALAWERHAKAQALFAPPAVKVIGGFKRSQYIDAAEFLLGQAVQHTRELTRQMAVKEENLAFLRRKNEWLLLSLEKSRRMISGAGYSLRTITAELPTGTRTIGPGGDVNTMRFRQLLPCDAAGLRGIGLRVIRSVPGSLATSHRPAVCLQVIRESDGCRLMEYTASFRELAEGWFNLDLDDDAVMSFGDAALDVAWCEEAKDGAPLFALADLSADRFGDSNADTLALRIYSGLRPLPTEEEGAGKMVPELFESISLLPADLGALAVWPFADTAPEDSGETISFNDDWLQTHALEGRASGAKLSGLLPADTVSVSASVCTAHESGPACMYALVAIERGTSLANDSPGKVVEQILDDLLQGKQESAASSADGIHVACKQVTAGQLHPLTLTFATPLSNTTDLFLVVRPAGSHAAYGWCRWSNFEYRVHRAAETVQLDDIPTGSDQGSPLLMRTQKFPELAGRIEFISGTAKLHELGRELGFLPLLISEETGSLQTHPLRDHVSAAIFEGGVPTGSLRVASAVETAHDSAPAFLYVIAVLDPSIKEKERAVRNMMQRIKPDDSRTWQGINGKKTLQWQAKVLYARQAAMLELELAETATKAHDVVFAVKPVVDSVSYGWCRWYSYNVTAVSGVAGAGSSGPALVKSEAPCEND